MKDPYYSRPEVSNSDLGWLKNQLFPRDMPDPTNAYKFGTLIDAMITEPEKVNYFKRLVDDEQYTLDDFATAEEMKKAFYMDDFCRAMRENADGQRVMITTMNLNFKGIDFTLQTRCKWDLWRDDWGWGGDVKSTACTTQRQFEEACRYFDYHRQRAFYMTIAGSQRDILIGISKKNFKVFKLPITRDCSFFKDGYEQVLELGFRHWTMFGEYKKE
jgi:hypothetical protein